MPNAKQLDQVLGWRQLVQSCFMALNLNAAVPVLEEARADYAMAALRREVHTF